MQFLSFTTLLFAALTQSYAASASPTPTADAGLTADTYKSLIERFTGDSTSTSPTTCSLDGAQIPLGASSPLPAPVGTLTHVLVGRGTQNYTCTNDTAVPVADGALATLFNATCLAGPFPQLLAIMPGIALHFPVPTTSDADSSAADALLSGHHFFSDATTPVFNLNTTEHEWGSVACKKANSTAAPNPATDVPWLKLTMKSADGCSISEVYRVNTAGGQPPATCAGMGAAFQVQYAAEYWMYSGPPNY